MALRKKKCLLTSLFLEELPVLALLEAARAVQIFSEILFEFEERNLS